MRPYAFLPPAREELSQAAEFYESQAAGLGEDFVMEAERVIELVVTPPSLVYPIWKKKAPGACCSNASLSLSFTRSNLSLS